MLLESGEVFTVLEDLSQVEGSGITVQETHRFFSRGDVRPAGHTRQRDDLATFIVEREAPVPFPENCVSLSDPGKFLDELHSQSAFSDAD